MTSTHEARCRRHQHRHLRRRLSTAAVLASLVGLPLLLTHPTHHPRYLVALSDPQDEGLVRWCALAFRVLSCHPECLDDETNGRILEALVRLCEVQVSESQPKIKI